MQKIKQQEERTFFCFFFPYFHQEVSENKTCYDPLKQGDMQSNIERALFLVHRWLCKLKEIQRKYKFSVFLAIVHVTYNL